MSGARRAAGVEEPRLFTAEEANAIVPRLRPLLSSLRETYHEYRFAREQWEELESFDKDGAETALWRDKANALGERVLAELQGIRALGADVKDPTLGLIDFHARRADGSIVLLCYRDDEDAIRFWHPVETGFAGRRPLDEL